jgi:tetratricopeptide (TPR) repeat protein
MSKPSPLARWCLIALAELDLGRGETAGLDEFVAWTERSPSFPRYYAVAQVYRQHGRTAEALAALREGVKHTLAGRNDEETHGPESECYESALFAFRKGRPDLALSICDKWEQYVQAQGYGERSYYAIRAASYLATGRQPEAVQEVARAVQENREHKTWADNLPALERAIQAGDRSFVDEPGELRSDDLIFLDEIQ